MATGTQGRMGRVKQFVLGAVSMLVALMLALFALLYSVGSPGSGQAVDAPAATASASPSHSADDGHDHGSEGTTLTSVRLTSDEVLSPDGELTDVSAIGSGVTLTDEGLRAERLDIDATLPFATAAGQIGAGVTLSAAPEGRAALRRTVNVLGREINVRATGQVRAVDGQLAITPDTIDLDGPDWLDSAGSAVVRRLVTIRHTVQGVPEGMALTAVSVQADGFHAHLRGSDVTLSR